MEIRLLKTEEDYQKSLSRFEELFDSSPNTPQGDEAEVLALLIEKYEEEHYPIEAPNPLEAIKFRMEQMDLSKKDLAGILGYKSRVSEIFNLP